LFYLRRE